jgi:glycosyltransferase involved in cell wall biosynthesis
VRQLVRAHDVVHIHSMWNWPTFWAAHVAKQENVPVVFRPAGSLDRFDVLKHERSKSLLGPLFLRRLFEAPNVFHCTAQRESDQLVTYGGRAIREILPLPVLGQKMATDLGSELRGKFGISADAPVVGFLSRLNYKKGLELLLPALAQVRVHFPGLHFLLAGAGEKEIERMVSDLIATHGLADCTHRLGLVEGPDKAAVLAAADVFALPSQNENFGVSVIEALSAGRPVLVSPEVYITSEIEPSPALVVCARTVDAIALNLAKLLASVQCNRAELAVEAESIWTRHFAPDVLRSRYADFYQRVILDAQLK